MHVCAERPSREAWSLKLDEKQVQAKWREEIRLQQKDLHPNLHLTDNMVSAGAHSEIHRSSEV